MHIPLIGGRGIPGATLGFVSFCVSLKIAGGDE